MTSGCRNTELIPQWETLQKLPWASNNSLLVGETKRSPSSLNMTSDMSSLTMYRVYCDQASVPLPRTRCLGQLEKLRKTHKLYLLSASELEFCLASKDDWSKPMFGGASDNNNGGGPEIFTTLQHAKVEAFSCAVDYAMESVDIDIQTMNTEYGPGQMEITFAPKFGICSPDSTSTFRTGVKEIAMHSGMLATFQSKPFGLGDHMPGNGGHFNVSDIYINIYIYRYSDFLFVFIYKSK